MSSVAVQTQTHVRSLISIDQLKSNGFFTALLGFVGFWIPYLSTWSHHCAFTVSSVKIREHGQ